MYFVNVEKISSVLLKKRLLIAKKLFSGHFWYFSLRDLIVLIEPKFDIRLEIN